MNENQPFEDAWIPPELRHGPGYVSGRADRRSLFWDNFERGRQNQLRKFEEAAAAHERWKERNAQDEKP